MSVVLNDVAPGPSDNTERRGAGEPVGFWFSQPGFCSHTDRRPGNQRSGSHSDLHDRSATQPSADVTIDLSSDHPNEGVVSPASLTFSDANWNVPQTVTVTGVDDAVDDGDVVYRIIGSAAVSSDPDYDGLLPDEVSVTNADDDPKLLQVIQFESTSSGFVVQLSQPLDPSVLNVADDVQVVGASTGIVLGSLIVDPGLHQMTFLQTGGRLSPDIYTITLKSGAAAFRDTTGQLLDGNADGVVTAGDDYVTTMVIDLLPMDTIEVSLPDFARGYGQPVNLPANDLTAGLPLTISEGFHVSGLDLHLHYDPTLLEISGFASIPTSRAGEGRPVLLGPVPEPSS